MMSEEEKALKAAWAFAEKEHIVFLEGYDTADDIYDAFLAGVDWLRKERSSKSAERKRELRKDPSYREAENARIRERRHTEEYRAKRRAAYAKKKGKTI